MVRGESSSAHRVLVVSSRGGKVGGTHGNYEDAAQRPRFLTPPSWGLGFQHMYLRGTQEHSNYNPPFLGSSSVKQSLSFFPSSGFHHSFMKGEDREARPLAPVCLSLVSVLVTPVSVTLCDGNEDESGEIKRSMPPSLDLQHKQSGFTACFLLPSSFSLAPTAPPLPGSMKAV